MAFEVFIPPKVIPILLAERKQMFIKDIQELRRDRTRDGLPKFIKRKISDSIEVTPPAPKSPQHPI